MNKGNELLAVLDRLYGNTGRRKSTIRKVVERVDERTGEHVVVIEYRVQRGKRSNCRSVDKPKKQQSQKKPESQLELLQDINRRAVLRKSPTKGPPIR